MQLKRKTNAKVSAVYGEGAVTDRICQKWFAKYRPGVSRWTMMLHGWEDQLKLLGVKSRH